MACRQMRDEGIEQRLGSSGMTPAPFLISNLTMSYSFSLLVAHPYLSAVQPVTTMTA
ncbi:hypothetical protein C8J56DRAFT_1051536 [Mycena floridula]|nr:hypothetical protein C8J56DRAFT_1051536 [Mycena floridula]